MSRSRRLALALALASLHAACLPLLYDDRCGDPSRDVTATARFHEPDDPQSGYAQLTLVERESGENSRTIWYYLHSRALYGHVRAARLLDARSDRLLMELPVTPGLDDDALDSRTRPYTGPTPFDDLFWLVLGSHVALEIETDLPGRERERRTLIVAHWSTWGRAHCS